MIVTKPRYRNKISNIVINCDSYNIEQVEKIKILGMYVTNTLDQTPNINAITQKVNYRINVLSSIVKYSDHKTRKILYESIIISVFRYCCETLIDSRAQNLNILNHSLILVEILAPFRNNLMTIFRTTLKDIHLKF